MANGFNNFSKNIFKLQMALVNNPDLCKMLYYQDPEVLSMPEVAKITINSGRYIALAPNFNFNDFEDEKFGAKIIIGIPDFNTFNANNHLNHTFSIDVLVPEKSWILDDFKVRAFEILEIITDVVKETLLEGLTVSPEINGTFEVYGPTLFGYACQFSHTDFK